MPVYYIKLHIAKHLCIKYLQISNPLYKKEIMERIGLYYQQCAAIHGMASEYGFVLKQEEQKCKCECQEKVIMGWFCDFIKVSWRNSSKSVCSLKIISKDNSVWFFSGLPRNYYLEMKNKYGGNLKCNTFIPGQELRKKYHNLLEQLQETRLHFPEGMVIWAF